MRRKLLISTLILLYSASAIGMPLHFHYCMGELKHVSLLVRAECQDETAVDRCCSAVKTQCCTGHAADQCCDDSTEWLQEDVPAVCQKPDTQTPLDPGQMGGICDTEPVAALTFAQTPPLCTGQASPRPIYLLQCSLIYYG